MIKYIISSIILVLISCGSGTQDASSPTSTKNSGESTQFPVRGNDTTEDPVMGGPSDITIKFTDITSDFTSKLIGCYADQNYLVDTINVKSGLLKYSKAEGLPQGMYFVSVPSGSYVQIFCGEDQKFEMEVNSTNPAYTMKVDGDFENELFYTVSKYEAKINPLIQHQINRLQANEKGSEQYEDAKKRKLAYEQEKQSYYDSLAQKYPNSLFVSFKLGGQNPQVNEDLPKEAQVPQYRRDFWPMVDFSDRRLLRTPMIGNKFKRYFEELTPQNPDSLVAAADYLISLASNSPEYYKVFTNLIVKKYEPTKTTLMDPEAVFVHMIQKYFTLDKAFWADTLQINALQTRAHEMAQSRIGVKAPNVTSKDIKGNTVSLLDSKKDYLIVYMFNPDCEHCQEQTPKLISWFQKNKAEADVFAIAIETEDKLWKDYVNKLNFPFTSVFDPTNRSIYAKYYVDITPELYVIGPDRTIIGKNLKVFQIDTIIQRDKEKRKK